MKRKAESVAALGLVIAAVVFLGVVAWRQLDSAPLLAQVDAAMAAYDARVAGVTNDAAGLATVAAAMDVLAADLEGLPWTEELADLAGDSVTLIRAAADGIRTYAATGDDLVLSSAAAAWREANAGLGAIREGLAE
jgi:hypothetical protein